MTTGYNRDRNPLDLPSRQELLDCLTTYPKGTRGRANEEILISTLHDLCIKHGFGCVGQLVEAIDAIWRKSERADRLVRFYAQHREDMREIIASRTGTTDTQ